MQFLDQTRRHYTHRARLEDCAADDVSSQPLIKNISDKIDSTITIKDSSINMKINEMINNLGIIAKLYIKTFLEFTVNKNRLLRMQRSDDVKNDEMINNLGTVAKSIVMVFTKHFFVKDQLEFCDLLLNSLNQIMITNEKGRLLQSEILLMVRNTLNEEKLKEKFEGDDRRNIEKAAQEMLNWLNKNPMKKDVFSISRSRS